MKTKLGMAFRAAQPRLRTREQAETRTGITKIIGMCEACPTERARVFMGAWALDRNGMRPREYPESPYFIVPLNYQTAIYYPSHVFDEAYSTRIMFLELLSILADEGWTAKDATGKGESK